MRKLLFIIIFVFMCFGLFACSNNNQEEPDIPSCDHIINKVRTKAATCTEDGHTAYYECELCGYKEDYQVIEKLGHEYQLFMGKKATVTEDGYTDYYKCHRCGDIKDQEVIKAFGHVHDSVTLNAVKESKTSCGYKELECKICGSKYIEYLNALDRKEIFMNDVKVLMIGNSFTNFNTLIELMNKMMESEGLNIQVSKFSYGNQYLYDYIPGEQGDYYDSLIKFMKGKSFDIVFLQEQSNNAATNPNDFFNSVRVLYDYFTNLGSTVVLYETWSYRNGYNGWTYDEMSQRLSASYEAIAKELGIKVSRCGTAFNYMYQEHNEVNLNNTDNVHPSTLGTYMVALVHYATITGRSPIGINYTYNDYLKNENITWHSVNERVEISEEMQKVFEELAYKAVFGDSQVKPEFSRTTVE